MLHLQGNCTFNHACMYLIPMFTQVLVFKTMQPTINTDFTYNLVCLKNCSLYARIFAHGVYKQ